MGHTKLMQKQQPPLLFDTLNLPTDVVIAGIDEVGRGPLAGPVVAAAVIISADRVPLGVTDSKKLSHAARKRLYPQIQQAADAFGIGMASVEEIDDINILQASLLAMSRAHSALGKTADLVLVDGKHLPKLNIKARAIVGGDLLVPQIAAASIIAKVTRDQMMAELDKTYPGYGWARNMGYGTAEHLASLTRLGPTKHHRASFAPVRRLLADNTSSTIQ